MKICFLELKRKSVAMIQKEFMKGKDNSMLQWFVTLTEKEKVCFQWLKKKYVYNIIKKSI